MQSGIQIGGTVSAKKGITVALNNSNGIIGKILNNSNVQVNSTNSSLTINESGKNVKFTGDTIDVNIITHVDVPAETDSTQLPTESKVSDNKVKGQTTANIAMKLEIESLKNTIKDQSGMSSDSKSIKISQKEKFIHNLAQDPIAISTFESLNADEGVKIDAHAEKTAIVEVENDVTSLEGGVTLIATQGRR